MIRVLPEISTSPDFFKCPIFLRILKMFLIINFFPEIPTTPPFSMSNHMNDHSRSRVHVKIRNHTHANVRNHLISNIQNHINPHIQNHRKPAFNIM